MYSIKIDSNHMMSVICGIKVDQPWRSQPCVELRLPYDEWLLFMKTYGVIFKDRSPDSMYCNCDESSDGDKVRTYLYHVAFSLYNEVMVSANKGMNATLVTPYNPGSYEFSGDELQQILDSITDEEISYIQEMFRSFNPATHDISYRYLSSWNLTLVKLSIVILRVAHNETPTIFSINWRL